MKKEEFYNDPLVILNLAKRKAYPTEEDLSYEPDLDGEVKELTLIQKINRDILEIVENLETQERSRKYIRSLYEKGFRLGAIYPTFETDVDKETGEIFFRCACEESYEQATGKKSQKPCKSPGKHPIGLWHPAGVWNFTRYENAVKKYWKEPKAQNKTDYQRILPNVAIATGVNFFVIDIDKKNGKDGYSNMHIVKQITKEFDIIGRVRTPSGGEHIYCRADGYVVKSVNLCEGIEIKGYGSYVLAPPSQVNGIPYEEIQPLQTVRTEAELRPTKILEFAINKRGLDIKRRNETPEINYRNFEALRNKRIKEFELLAKDPKELKKKYPSKNGFDIAVILSLKRRGYSDSEIIAYYRRYLIGRGWHTTLLRRFDFKIDKMNRYLKSTAIPLAKKMLKESDRKLHNLLIDYYKLLHNKHIFCKKEGLTQTDREVLTFMLVKTVIDLKRDTIRISLSKINENLPILSSSKAISDSLKRLSRKGFISILEKGKGGEKDTNRRGTVYRINPVPDSVKEKYIFLEDIENSVQYHSIQKMVRWYRTEFETLFQEDALTGQSGRLERAFFNIIAKSKGKEPVTAKEISKSLGCTHSSALNLMRRLAKKGYGTLTKHKKQFLFKLFSASIGFLKEKFKEVAQRIGRLDFLKDRVEKIKWRRYYSYLRLKERKYPTSFEIVKVS